MEKLRGPGEDADYGRFSGPRAQDLGAPPAGLTTLRGLTYLGVSVGFDGRFRMPASGVPMSSA